MNRLFARGFALLALLALPAVAHAQKEPPHTKETRNAEKFIGLAITRQDPAQKRQFLEQALPSLLEAITKNPDNARAWLLAGGVYSGIGAYAAADSAFTRAAELYPGYAEQIDLERHAAWEAAFNTAVRLINEQKTDEGIVELENAERMYDMRPEAKYYLGLFYLQKEDVDKAQNSLRAAMNAVQGPLRAKVPAAVAEDWDRLAGNARIRLSNVEAFRATGLYDKQQYDSAAVSFQRARELSPFSRDHLFNLMQSNYALALAVDKERDSKKSPELDRRAQSLYQTIVALTDTLRTIDPRNEDIFFFSSRAYKVLGELTTDAALKARHIDALRGITTEYEKLTFLINDIQIEEGDTAAVVKGNVSNKLIKPGESGTLTFEMLDLNGNVIGSAPITFTATATADKAAQIPFSVTIPITAAVAGWRYRL